MVDNKKFITLDGMDGSGKSTQLHLLYEKLKNEYGEDKILITREPGGTDISEQIRQVLLNIENKKMDPMCECMLYAAARVQHVNEAILPALAEGKIVLCDRFLDSSVAYQGFGRELGLDTVLKINSYATNGVEPGLTFMFMIDHEKSLKRKEKQQQLDRLESEGSSFHEKIYQGYQKMIELYPERVVEVNADDTIEHIHKKIYTLTKKQIEK